MRFELYLSQTALIDITDASVYYNSKNEDLSKRLVAEIDAILNKIAEMPEIYSLRYKDVRSAKVSNFPYSVFYKINESKRAIQVLRIFNTHQQPFWKH